MIREIRGNLEDMPIETIDQELIKSLRMTGQHELAKKLLRKFHENGKKNRKQLQKELINKEKAIHNHKKKKMGLCIQGNCEEKINGNHSYCEIHLKEKRDYAKKKREETKSE